MNEPWNLRTEDERTDNTVYNVIVFCEDGKIEPIYFESYKIDGVLRVTAKGDYRAMHENLDKTLDYCREKGLIETYDNGKERLAVDEGTQLWCVFDRDKVNANKREDQAFNNSIQRAINFGINVAWSNDAFELWVLMHFEEIPMADDSYTLRNKYYARLTDVMINWAHKTDEHATVTALPDFSYVSRLKNEYRFKNVVMPLLKNQTHLAIERARQLESYHNSPEKQNHQKAPCTLVHHLVLELLRLGGKEI